MSELIHLTDDSFAKEVLESDIPVLVDFWAVWCGPCLAIAPVVEELSQEYEGRIKVGKIDVDSEPKTTSQYSIRSIPTLLIFKQGKVVEQIIGAMPKRHLVSKLDAALA